MCKICYSKGCWEVLRVLRGVPTLSVTRLPLCKKGTKPAGKTWKVWKGWETHWHSHLEKKACCSSPATLTGRNPTETSLSPSRFSLLRTRPCPSLVSVSPWHVPSYTRQQFRALYMSKVGPVWRFLCVACQHLGTLSPNPSFFTAVWRHLKCWKSSVFIFAR